MDIQCQLLNGPFKLSGIFLDSFWSRASNHTLQNYRFSVTLFVWRSLIQILEGKFKKKEGQITMYFFFSLFFFPYHFLFFSFFSFSKEHHIIPSFISVCSLLANVHNGTIKISEGQANCEDIISKKLI